MTDLEQHQFYEDFVRTLRSRGVLCAITSGLACVHYGVAESTKDCDLLCHPGSFDALLGLLEETKLEGRACQYRGNISPPLDARWHDGGWTSHFEWPLESDAVTLDVFGKAVRQSSPWEDDVIGLYAGMSVVAEMKRTDRPKDWPFITSLGMSLLQMRDPRGWLHLFDEDAFTKMLTKRNIPAELLAGRPVLQLAANRDVRLRPALLAEQQFWQELDRVRIRIHRAALRPFVLAMGRVQIAPGAGFRERHAARLACAGKTLKRNPVAEHGVGKLIEEARQATAAFVQPDLMQWLPNVRPHFSYLEV